MIIRYGERGVVNTMVEYLVRQDAATRFLPCVQWANGSTPRWLDKVSGTTFIVELGLAEFGTPDLILVCTSTIDPKPYCVFLEAKVAQYIASAVSNNEGMSRQGYNSGCNGQLCLKYRFVKALECWDGHQARIVEPASVHSAYRRSPPDGLGDRHLTSRKLQKREILRKLSELKLAGLPLDHFGFVALTWDRAPFFHVASEYLPRFFDESGLDVFPSLAGQVGWLGYEQLKGIPGLLEHVRPALRLTLGTERLNPQEVDPATATWPTLIPRPVGEMRPDLQQLMHDLEHLGVGIFGRDAVLFHTGSVSIKPASRVEVKIVPQEHGQDGFVMLGLRPEWPLQDWSGLEPRGYKVQDQPFRFVRLPAASAECLALVESVLKQLRDVLIEPRETEQ